MPTNVTITLTTTGVLKGIRLYLPNVQRPRRIALAGGVANVVLNDGFYTILADFFGPVGTNATLKVSTAATALNRDGKITFGTHATIDREFEVRNGGVYP